jgi:hypothetical protein
VVFLLPAIVEVFAFATFCAGYSQTRLPLVSKIWPSPILAQPVAPWAYSETLFQQLAM